MNLLQGAVTGQKDKQVPDNWENTHNNVIMTYRMNYHGTDLDPNLPHPDPFKEVVVPSAKPREDDPAYLLKMPGDSEQGNTTALSQQVKESAEDRLAMLQEIRAHMDLLNDFVGIIPQEQLHKRKRELYLAMPNTPPTASERAKRLRQVLEGLEGMNEDMS